MKEEWKDIIGYEGSYQVSNMGNVRSLDRLIKTSNNKQYVEKGSVKSQRLNQDGYPRVTLSKSSVKTSFSVSRLVAEHFIPKPYNKNQVNHISGIKTDNSIFNLEWCTSKENIKHSHANGLANVINGENHVWAKLNNEEAIEIYKLSNSKVPLKEIAEKYNISITAVSNIKNGVRWSRLTRGVQNE